MRQRITIKGELLVLAHTPNAAKQIESLLRSAGHAVHVIVAPGLDSFTDIIEKSDVCTAIHDAEFGDCDLIQVVEAVGRVKPRLPVLLLSGNSDPRAVTEAMSKGARGIISLSNPTHLELVLQQEFEGYQLHAELQGLRDKLAELENVRTQDLGTNAAPGMRVQEGIVVQANQALALALNYSEPDELIALPFMDLVAPDDQGRIKKLVKECLKRHKGEEQVEFNLVTAGGSSFPLKCRFIPIEHDAEPALEVRGLEPLAASPAQPVSGGGIARQALYQAITERSKSASKKNLVSLVFFSIDEFEDIEQRVGYAGAEELVEQAIKMLRKDAMDTDQVFRFSPSEFALVGQRDSLDSITDLLANYQRGLARHIFNAASKEVSSTVSVVVHPMDATPENPEELLRSMREESRTLEAKGGNSLTVVGGAAEAIERQRKSEQWLARIRKALANDSFELAYQNIASLSGEERQFSDILIRMIDDNSQELLAREFIPTAENNGLMPEIDRWVINRAAQVIQQQIKDQRDPLFFIRIAEDTLAQGQEFEAWLLEFLQREPQVKGHMVLVFREMHLQDYMKSALNLVNAARSMGLETALDHFGKNRMSHQLLSRMKINYVKLHWDFTEVVTGSGGAELEQLEVIMEQARANKVRTIAERVSDANAMARLWQLGVNYIMGSHVHEPDRELTSTSFRLG